MQESINGRFNEVRANSEGGHNQFHVLFIEGEYAIENGYFVVSKWLFPLTVKLKERLELCFLCMDASLDLV